MNPKNSNPDFTGERHIFHYTFLFDAYVLIRHIYEDFEVASIIMKIQKDAGERQELIKEYQFVDAKEECNISLEDYYIRYF